MQAILASTQSYLLPLAFAAAYVLLSPWLSLGIKIYNDLASDQFKKRDRRRELEDLEYRREIEVREAKVMHLQRTKLQDRKEIDLLREELNVLFEQLSTSLENRFQASADRLRQTAAKIESEYLPQLLQRVSEARDQVAHSEASVKSGLDSLRNAILEARREANLLAQQVRPQIKPLAKDTQESSSNQAAMHIVASDLFGGLAVELPNANLLASTGMEPDEIPAFLRRTQRKGAGGGDDGDAQK